METRVPWPVAEPTRFRAEQTAMASVAPGLTWDAEELVWHGTVPSWPFDRSPPELLTQFLAERALVVRVEYSQGFPMVAPRIVPVDPVPDPMTRTRHDWHVNGDGSLCLLQAASDWDGTGAAAALIIKAAGWFLEYLLMEAGRIEQMSSSGIVSDSSWDHLFVPDEDT